MIAPPDSPFGPSRIVGAIIAGGRSRRFGSDKALALFHGRPLIAHAADALAQMAAEVVVCGRAFASYRSLPDRPAPDFGPLGGLNAALGHAHAHGFDGVLATGCDMPVFPADLAARLIGAEAAIVAGQYLMGWWPAALAPMLDAHLRDTPDRSVRNWLAAAQPRIVEGPILPNINTPDDLRAMEVASE